MGFLEAAVLLMTRNHAIMKAHIAGGKSPDDDASIWEGVLPPVTDVLKLSPYFQVPSSEHLMSTYWCQALVRSTSSLTILLLKQILWEMSLLFLIIAIPKGPTERTPTQMAKLRSKLGFIAWEPYTYPLLSAAFNQSLKQMVSEVLHKITENQ